jgi:hypothetical protein
MAALAAAVAVGIAACGNSSTSACVSVPQTIRGDRLLTSATRIAVPVGAIVFAVLVEPDSYTSKPGFPWRTPTTSDPAVLARVRLCKQTGASTLPVSITGFRARRRGSAIVTASLAPGWPGSLKRGPEPVRNLVRVN